MKIPNWAIILGAGAAVWYFFIRKASAAETTASTSFPIASQVSPTQAETPYPTSVFYTEPSKALATSTSLVPLSAPIQIQEEGKNYIPPYQIVGVNYGTEGAKIGISFGDNKYTELSPGFAKKLVQTGLAPSSITSAAPTPTKTLTSAAAKSSSSSFASGSTAGKSRFY